MIATYDFCEESSSIECGLGYMAAIKQVQIIHYGKTRQIQQVQSLVRM